MTLAAAAGYVIAWSVAVASIGVMNAERAAAAMSRFGNATAEDLAHLALDPLLRGDRIELGLLTNRLAARPEIRRIAIHTADERPFVVVGAAPATAPTYVRPVAAGDTVAGEVSIALDPASFAVPSSLVLAESWEFAFAGLALTVFLFYLGSRLGSRDPSGRASKPTPTAPPAKTFVVVADLPRQVESDTSARDALLEGGLAVCRKVANLYAGHAAALSGAGVVLVFPSSGFNDRCFEAICAAWLVRSLLASAAGNGDEATHAFRYGVDFSARRIPMDDGAIKPSAVSDVLLLASLASAGDLVIGQTAYEALDRPQRVDLVELENPATEALSSAVALPRGKVSGIADEYDALLTRQSEVLAKGTA
ncbi:MAG: hypothetical protein OXK76_04870 [Gammaproteobacteria bacterium]|nr:hypothetical protein [Gammaproteobacteria bacterium]